MRTIEKWNQKWFPHHLQNLKTVDLRTANILKNLTVGNPEMINSTYIWGTVGSGKTVLAAKLLMKWSLYQFINGGTHQKIIFLPLTDFIENLQKEFSTNTKILFDVYKQADLLVLDDIGVLKQTEWVYQSLYALVSYRYRMEKTTIYTSNSSLAQLTAYFADDRITSRIADDCTGNIIQFKTKTRRKT